MVGAVDGFGLVGVLGDGGFVITHFLEPSDGVFAPVAARRARCIAEAEVDFATLEMEVFHDLHTGLAGADDQRLALGNLGRPFIIDRVDLFDGVGNPLGTGWDEGDVKAADGDDDVIAIPRALIGGDVEVTVALGDGCDGHAFEHRWAKFFRVELDVVNDFILHHKAFRIVAVVIMARQAALVVGRDEAEAVPAFRPPRVADAVFFQNDVVVHPALAEAVAGGKPRLAATDDDDGNVFGICKWHGLTDVDNG